MKERKFLIESGISSALERKFKFDESFDVAVRFDSSESVKGECSLEVGCWLSNH